jgi:hypothetical protein
MTLAKSQFCWMFDELHCEQLPASTVVHDFEQHTMSTCVNEDASSWHWSIYFDH